MKAVDLKSSIWLAATISRLANELYGAPAATMRRGSCVVRENPVQAKKKA
jgi:hypothetical protein